VGEGTAFSQTHNTTPPGTSKTKEEIWTPDGKGDKKLPDRAGRKASVNSPRNETNLGWTVILPGEKARSARGAGHSVAF